MRRDKYHLSRSKPWKSQIRRGLPPTEGQCLPLDQHPHRALDQRLESREQFGAERAVDHAVIAGQGRRHLAHELHRTVSGFDWAWTFIGR